MKQPLKIDMLKIVFDVVFWFFIFCDIFLPIFGCHSML